MFTGLVEDVGKLLRVERTGGDARLTLEPSRIPLHEVALGDSVAVNGACLTVVVNDGKRLIFDVSVETLNVTTLGHLPSGSPVNLERALAMGQRLGGHMVAGHVDGQGRLLAKTPDGRSTRLTFSFPEEVGKYIVAKGSIAIDGVSLTVNTVEPGHFSVNVVPHTLSHTQLGSVAVGGAVNLETDLIGRYVERLLEGSAPGGKGSVCLETWLRGGS
ncbi:MAG: riboflavin synthase [Alphaproteobacteria bacterium CG_4_10_14_0_2_um_filter_63_37]|nr:MAG: riboflavin synthase subunit alpha [Proteobacteria bacterium CG1_02_64_396]PJA25975.1 MAG: riboflavin synthase [Alphaproteobacteria bacterium CG_4_10_14_0_2_um_filter_63_37]